MSLDDRLETVSVIGGAGKMGKGIAALVAMEMVQTKLRTGSDKTYKLNMMDINDDALEAAKIYVEKQAVKYAERNIEALRTLYRDANGGALPTELLHNTDIINQYVADVGKVIRPEGDSEKLLTESKLVFEAIIEDEDAKVEKFKELKAKCGKDTYFFTNTSSIPISRVDEGAELEGNVLGFHFYNPPPMMPLLEMISNDNTNSDLKTMGLELAKRLGKVVVESKDVAGFIGNGHFAREFMYASKVVEDLVQSEGMSEAEAIYTVNAVSQQYLGRAMGIFQTVDYVGLDVMKGLMSVMDTYIDDETIQSALLQKYMDKGVRGGQFPDMSQKDGFFQYSGRKIAGIIDVEKGDYIALSGENEADWLESNNEIMAAGKPEGVKEAYYDNLLAAEDGPAKIAGDYMRESARIANALVGKGIAASMDDMTTVLKLGFGHRESYVIPHVLSVGGGE